MWEESALYTDQENTFSTEIYREYSTLREYALLRDSCMDSRGILVKANMNKDLREKYQQIYERLSDIWMVTQYPAHQQTIDLKPERLSFVTQKPFLIEEDIGHIQYLLSHTPNSVQLEISYKSVLSKNTDSLLKIASYIKNHKLKSLAAGIYKTDQTGDRTFKEFQKIKKHLDLECETMDISRSNKILEELRKEYLPVNFSINL